MGRVTRAAFAILVAAGLAGCTSAQDVLEPSSIAPPSQNLAATQEPQGDAAPTEATGATTSSTAVAGATTGAPAAAPSVAAVQPRGARIQFAPVVGPSVEAATALSERLGTRARQLGVTLAPSGDPGTTHVLKGYLSTLDTGANKSIVFVWDVYSPSGARLHRISGQRPAGGGPEGWNGVSDDAMRGVADATMDAFAAWLAATRG